MKQKKLKKDNLNLNFKRNIDILEFLSKNNSQRPKLVSWFCCRNKRYIKTIAKEKKNKKYCDWIIANDISKSGNWI